MKTKNNSNKIKIKGQFPTENGWQITEYFYHFH